MPVPTGYVLVREAAALTGNTPDTIRQWVRRQLLPHARHVGRIYVKLDAVEQCRTRQRTSAHVPSPPPPGMITTRRAHDVTNIPLRTIQHLATTNRITATKHRGRWYVLLADLTAYATP